MIVTLIKKENIRTITLPEKVSGQYWLMDTDEHGNSFPLISIEGINDKWILKSNKLANIIDNKGNHLKEIPLETLSIYNLSVSNYKHKAFVFTEPITEDRQKFKKFIVNSDVEITIGRTNNNGIIFSNRFVSACHAKLVFYNNIWTIYDCDSTNGIFVNEQKVKMKELKPGDVIYIMGFKIIVGNTFIAINNPDGKVELKTDVLFPFIKQEAVSTEEDEYELEPPNYFYRSPRFKRDIEKAVFKIDPPPAKVKDEEVPLMLLLGPSLTMGMASMSTAIFAINNALANGNINSALPSVVMSFSMLLGTVMWPMLTKRYEKKRRHEKETTRQEKYREYLEKIAVMIAEECAKQEEILRENHVPISECVDRIKKVKRNLWERGIGQNDFLKLRVGLGNSLLLAEISYPERKFSIDNDNLQEELYVFCETPKALKDIPITISLFDNYISGIIGDRKLTKEFAIGLIFQIAALYSYDEVKMVFIYDADEEEEFGFTKWLPHVWSNDREFRFIATNNSEMKELSAYMEKEIEARSDTEDDNAAPIPYYVIFSMSKKLALRADMLKQIYSKNKNINMSVITFYDELKNLPKECTTVVELGDGYGKIFDKNDISGQSIQFKPDIFVKEDVFDLSIQLANIPLDTLENSYKLPTLITFLQMFGVGKVEHLNSLTRWKENNPTKTLETPVGVDAFGEIFKLDLHEKFHGPHGLVAGMTGSGKSEFIITYILSLAVNYHPDEVAFILIDYKGGGMAKSFENLPHTAGIITNLDGVAIKRSLISIESELKRRQAIFAQVSKEVGISNIDIYVYQRLYREGVVSEPLQHLFIIADEFAELKTQQPEFMEQLVSAARIGRSLGIHLILATQKPSGVVDDQIWSNSKFRVCLKVQERADSMDMLKRPDAAELTDTGRFYLQVGYNELFELGQSAWAGAPYYPSDRALIEKDNSVVVIDTNGRPIKQAKIDKNKGKVANPKKQLDAITEYLRKIADEENIKVRPLWLDPIPELIYLDDLKTKYNIKREGPCILNPVIGEYDDPARQRQCILTLPISKEGNAVIYGVAGSGKTTFITTMTYSLIRDYTPEEVNIYLLDFASETLRAFAKAPHVGDVVLSHESEKVNNLFKLLYDEIGRRRKLFADYGGDYNSYISSTGNKIPSIVVVINNFAAFTEIYEEKEEVVAFLSREGTKYGIFFVLTAVGTGAVRFRLLENFKQLIALQLNDETDYSTILGKTDGLFPSKYKGRGLVKLDKIYEFQVAHITDEPVPFSFIQKACEKIKASWNGISAKRIPILPEKVDLDFISEYIQDEKSLSIPIGVDRSTLEVRYYPFGSSYINMVLSSSDEYVEFVYGVSQIMANKCGFDVTMIDVPQDFASKDIDNITYYSLARQCEDAVSSLFEMVLYRNNTIKTAMEQGEEVQEFDHKVIIINSVTALKGVLTSEGNEKLDLILEKGEAWYNITIIIAEASNNLNSVVFDKWYKRHISQYDGIWVGSGIAEQYQLKLRKTTNDMYDDITPEFGYIVQKGMATGMKLLNMNKEDI